MGAPLHSGKRAGATGRTRDAYRPMSEINVTPFVDVMLVLLVVFMVTAPLLTVGIPLNLPQAKAPNLHESVEPLVVSIDAEGRLFVQETEIATEDLVERLATITALKADTRIFLRGDRTVAWEQIAQVLALLKTAGHSNLALITKLPKQAKTPEQAKTGEAQ